MLLLLLLLLLPPLHHCKGKDRGKGKGKDGKGKDGKGKDRGQGKGKGKDFEPEAPPLDPYAAFLQAQASVRPRRHVCASVVGGISLRRSLPVEQVLQQWNTHLQTKKHTLQKVSMSGETQDLVSDLLHEIGGTSHWRDCHFADILSPSISKRLLRERGVQQHDSLADG